MSDIREVARRAGVSTSTVSRTLSGKIFVKDETRQKILKAVAELNYHPNRAAQGLKEGKSRVLALILPDITNPLYPKLVKSIEMHAARLGFSLILFDTDNDKDTEIRYLESLSAHYVGGAIIVTATDDFSHVTKVSQSGIPLVVVNRDFDADFQCITNDNENGVYLITKYLLEQGHRQIACLQVDTALQRYRQRFDGFTRAHKELGVKIIKKLLVDKIETIDQAYGATKKLLALHTPPTAILSFTDILSFGVYSAIYDSGLKIPEDISVAGYDDIDISSHMFPTLTTYANPVAGVAKAALKCIVDEIENSEASGGKKNIVIEGNIVIRKSVRKITNA
jgi:DNA-binding LacI/PurR family transcriptional regulator